MRILIYGFGNLGKRHMQAALDMSLSTSVSIHDEFISPNTVRQQVAVFLASNGAGEKGKRVFVLDRTQVEGSDKFDLVIDATLAHSRLSRLSKLLLSLSYQPDAVLVEKLVVSRLSEGRDIRTFHSSFSAWNIYVHCPRSTWPAYRGLNSLFSQDSVDLQVDLVGTELGSNFIHFVALFDFILSRRIIPEECLVVDSAITWQPSERRHAVSEGYGAIILKFSRHSLKVSARECLGGDGATCNVSISSRGETLFSYSETSGELRSGGEIREEIAPFLSQSSYLYTEILQGNSSLPTFYQSIVHHELVFDCFEKSKLSGAVT